MKNFIMKALTVDKSRWYVFSIEDLPCMVRENEVSLLAIPNSPILLYDTICRGDKDNMMFEGDIHNEKGCRWLICYERGFYAINEDYTVLSIPELHRETCIGSYGHDITDFPVKFTRSSSTLFRYKEKTFRLSRICGAYDGKLLLRSCSEPVDPEDVQQECGCVYEGKRIFLGDVVSGGVVDLRNGDLVIRDSNDNFVNIPCVRRK